MSHKDSQQRRIAHIYPVVPWIKPFAQLLRPLRIQG